MNAFLATDLFIDGFNLSGGMLALTALNAGAKVTIRINEHLNTSYQPELSFFYPDHFKHALGALNNYRFLLTCSSLFPHLLFPQRVLYFKASNEINTKFNNAFDKLLKRDRESASFPIVTGNYTDYSVLSHFLPKGALVYEYRFDRNRATIELLKLCMKQGACVVDQTQVVDAKKTLKVKPFPNDCFSIHLPAYQWPLKNSIRIERNNFNLTFQPFEQGTLMHIYFSNQANIPQLIDQQLPELLMALNIPESDYNKNQFDELAEQVPSRKLHPNLPIIDPHLGKFRNTTTQAIRMASELMGKKLSLKRTLQNIAGEPMTFDRFRIIQSECDQQFDLAKQTGISYRHFVHLFYRYRHHIDVMIEAAYQMMEKERNPELIWGHVENDFLANEWETFFGAQNKKV